MAIYGKKLFPSENKHFFQIKLILNHVRGFRFLIKNFPPCGEIGNLPKLGILYGRNSDVEGTALCRNSENKSQCVENPSGSCLTFFYLDLFFISVDCQIDLQLRRISLVIYPEKQSMGGAVA